MTITIPREAEKAAKDVVRFALRLKNPDPDQIARAAITKGESRDHHN